jgi:hypothetical protein
MCQGLRDGFRDGICYGCNLVRNTIEYFDLPGEWNTLQDPVGGSNGAAAVADYDL